MKNLSKANFQDLIGALVATSAAVALLAGCGGGDGEDPLTIDVFAQQYSWSFGYPDQGNAFSDDELHVPVGRQADFQMYSQDVIHSFWVPEWNIKQATVPGVTATATVTPDKVGTYQLICAHLCGIDHGSMQTKVVVEPAAKFREWTEGLKRKVPASLQESVSRNKELEEIRHKTESNG